MLSVPNQLVFELMSLVFILLAKLTGLYRVNRIIIFRIMLKKYHNFDICRISLDVIELWTKNKMRRMFFNQKFKNIINVLLKKTVNNLDCP